MAHVVTRHFVTLCPTTPIDAKFNFSNFLQGRVDMTCRSVSSGLFLSHGVRQDTKVSVVLQGQKKESDTDTIVQWTGSQLVGLWPDDKSIATKLQRAVCHAFSLKCPAVGQKRELETPQPVAGVTACKKDFADVLNNLIKDNPGVHGLYLHELGQPAHEYFRDIDLVQGEPTHFVIVTGGPNGLTEDEEKVADGLNLTRISFPGPSLFASHCMVLINHYIDLWCMENNVDIKTQPEKSFEPAAPNHNKKKKPVPR